MAIAVGSALISERAQADEVCKTGYVCQIQHLYDQSMAPTTRDTINKQDNALAFATGNIPDVGGAFSVGLGLGSFGGENAIAFGLKSRPIDNLILSATIATADISNYDEAIGIGAGIGWRF